jgi:hypothetical protein
VSQPVGSTPETGGVSRSERKNAQARAALRPLHPGQRPLVVTIGSVLCGVLAASIVIAYVAGVEVDGDRPPIAQIVAPALLLGLACWGMWRARYWAVLGFQAMLLLLILASGLGLVQAQTAAQVAGDLGLLVAAGTFFYFMVKAMARIQMPQRPGPG